MLELDGLLPKVCFDQGARLALGWAHRARRRRRDARSGRRDVRGMGAGSAQAGVSRRTAQGVRGVGARRERRRARHGRAGGHAAAGRRAGAAGGRWGALARQAGADAREPRQGCARRAACARRLGQVGALCTWLSSDSVFDPVLT